MQKEILSELQTWDIRPEVFKKYFPTGEIKEIDPHMVSPTAMNLFEGLSRRFINPKDYRPLDFRLFFLIKHESSTVTYGAQQLKKHQDISTDEYKVENTELLTYIADVDRSGNLQGHGELRFYPWENRLFFKDRPFIGYTETEEKFQNKGLGTRRSILLNALAQMFYGLPAYSSDLMLPQGLALCEKLRELGYVEKYREDNNKFRYIFKT